MYPIGGFYNPGVMYPLAPLSPYAAPAALDQLAMVASPLRPSPDGFELVDHRYHMLQAGPLEVRVRKPLQAMKEMLLAGVSRSLQRDGYSMAETGAIASFGVCLPPTGFVNYPNPWDPGLCALPAVAPFPTLSPAPAPAPAPASASAAKPAPQPASVAEVSPEPELAEQAALTDVATRTAMELEEASPTEPESKRQTSTWFENAKPRLESAKQIASKAVKTILHDPESRALVPVAMRGMAEVFQACGQNEVARITRHAAKQMAEKKDLQCLLYLGQKAGQAVGGEEGAARAKRLVRAAIKGYTNGDGPEKVASTLAALAGKSAQIGAEATKGGVSETLKKFAPIVGDIDNLTGVHGMVKRALQTSVQSDDPGDLLKAALDLASGVGALLMPQIRGQRPEKGLTPEKFDRAAQARFDAGIAEVNVNANLYLTRKEAKALPAHLRTIYEAFVALPEHKGHGVTVRQFAEYFESLQTKAPAADLNADGMISQLERKDLPEELRALFTVLLRQYGRHVQSSRSSVT